MMRFRLGMGSAVAQVFRVGPGILDQAAGEREGQHDQERPDGEEVEQTLGGCGVAPEERQAEEEGAEPRQEAERVHETPPPVGAAGKEEGLDGRAHRRGQRGTSSRMVLSTSLFEKGFVMKREAPWRSASSRSLA